MAKKKQAVVTTEDSEVKAIPSIGGDVTPVFIDNSENKLPSEAEERWKAGVESAKEQQKAARAAEKKEEKNA